jgi:hypothetical protein
MTSENMPARDNEEPMTSRERRLGDYILKSIRQEVLRFIRSSGTSPPSGQVNGLTYTHWFRSYLLIPVLGWPQDRIRMGKWFDLILLDQSDTEVVTVETKGPFQKATEEEKRDYRRRLARLPRLVAAYFTNSLEWDRLDLHAHPPGGTQEIRGQASFDASQATAEETAVFFGPLTADRYLPYNRSLITPAYPYVLENLASEIEEPFTYFDYPDVF